MPQRFLKVTFNILFTQVNYAGKGRVNFLLKGNWKKGFGR